MTKRERERVDQYHAKRTTTKHARPAVSARGTQTTSEKLRIKILTLRQMCARLIHCICFLVCEQ